MIVEIKLTLIVLHMSASILDDERDEHATDENFASIPLNSSTISIPLQLFEDKPFAFTVTHPPTVCSKDRLSYMIDFSFGKECRFRLEWTTYIDKIQLIRRWDNAVCASLPLVEPLTDVRFAMFRDGAGLSDDNSCSNGYCNVVDACVVDERCPLADPHKLAGLIEMIVELTQFELMLTTCDWTLEMYNSTDESLIGAPWFSDDDCAWTSEYDALLKSAFSKFPSGVVFSSDIILRSVATLVLLSVMVCLLTVVYCSGSKARDEQYE